MWNVKGTMCLGQHAVVLQLQMARLYICLLPLRSLDVLISAGHQANSQYPCLPESHSTGISEADHSFSCMTFPPLAVSFFWSAFAHTVHVESGSIYMGLV